MTLYDSLPKKWIEFLNINKDYFSQIEKKIEFENINPKKDLIFRAFNLEPEKVKVVIIGQDPYPNPEDAMGLAFSVRPENKKIPASLRNIKKELKDDLGIEIGVSGDLTPWLNSGVLLLNRILTTREGESLAHENCGWEEFTNLVVLKLAQEKSVFILWGKRALELSAFIPEDKVIKGIHPSPLSAHRGFFGSKPFSKANKKLEEMGLTAIDWRI